MRSWMRLILSCAALVLPPCAAPAEEAQGPRHAGTTNEELWLEERDLAKDRFEVSRSTPARLVALRAEAARQVYLGEVTLFEAGRHGPERVEEARVLYLQARRLPSRPAEGRDVLEENWRAAWRVAQDTESAFEAARANYWDLYRSKYRLHDAALKLAITRPKK